MKFEHVEFCAKCNRDVTMRFDVADELVQLAGGLDACRRDQVAAAIKDHERAEHSVKKRAGGRRA